jgi:hypothetical protein
MFKSKIVCEVTIGDKLFQFLLDQDSPLGSVHDALVQMRGLVVDQMQKVVAEQQKKPEAKEPECQEKV